MSSFFDEASLVMIPSGYKDQKVYSVKPLDGSGDLTFSRASSATRVASNGLIEKVRTNLVTYSNDFSNAAWTTIVGTKPTTTQNVTDPFGVANNAWTITGAGTTFSRLIRLSITLTTAPQTLSFFVKKGTATTVTIFTAQTSVADFTFNFDTQAITGIDGGYNVIRKAEALSDGWFRLSMTLSTTSGTSNETWGFSLDGSITTTFLLFGGMLENGDIATDYIPTTTAAVSVGPVSGLPRLDYLNSSCPRLLLEPQRTNLVTYSEQFDNAVYDAKVNITVSANTSETLDPSGYYGADKITSNSTVGNHFIRQPFTVTPSTTYTSSVYIKAGNTSVFAIGDGYGINVLATFDLAAVTATNVTGFNANIQSVGNGWYRCSASMIPSGTTMGLLVYSGTTYAGTETDKYYYLFGAQCEAGAYATSYIPTLGTSVTRVADAASKTSASALIGQTEGTLFVDVSGESLQNDSRYMSISDFNDPNKRITIYQASGNINVYCSAGSTFNLNYNPPAGRLKIAFGYKSGQYVLYVNGVNAASSTEAVVQGCPDLGLGVNEYLGTANPPAVGYNQALLFKTRLTNAQLAELTTL